MHDGIFFINHALSVNQLSVYNSEERFQQTLETLDSIDKYCPNNIKFIFDSSPNEPDPKYIDEITGRGVYFFYFGQHPIVNTYSKQGRRSLAECVSFMAFIDIFRDKYNFPAKRIYKLSGRYRLNENFIPDDPSYSNAFVFSESLDSWMSEQQKELTHTDKLYRLRLWHMDYCLLDFFRENLELIYKDCLKFGLDVEHAYYRNLYLNTCKIVEVKKIGVCGNVAPDGAYVDE